MTRRSAADYVDDILQAAEKAVAFLGPMTLTAFRADEKTELREGVREGEQVVTTANFLIDSESRLRAAIEGTAASGAAPPPSACDHDFDQTKFPDKYRECRACEIQHQGMGEMVTDCKNAIPRPWK